MKLWILPLLGICALASCSKDDTISNDKTMIDDQPVHATATGVSISGWEQNASWEHYDSSDYRIYYMDRSTPDLSQDLLSNGLVLVYARVNATDPQYARFAQPNPLGFYFVPPNARPVKNAFYFYDRDQAGNIRVSYSTKALDGSMPGGVTLSQFQFQYILIPQSYLQSQHLTADDIRSHYTYDQLIALLGK